MTSLRKPDTRSQKTENFRAVAATVIAVSGGWLAAAIGIGPVTRPLPLVAGIATVILGIPWWFHRRRRAKARVEKTIAAWPGVAENAGLADSEILSVVVDAWGWTARVLLRKGATSGVRPANRMPYVCPP